MKKKIGIDVKIVIIFIILLIGIVSFSAKSYAVGDVNGDGNVSSSDYALLRMYILKKKSLADNEIKRADVNNDKSINTKDYMLIRSIILGKNISSLISKDDPLPIENINYLEAYFLNTQTKTYATNEAIILKTYDNKIIMIDTADKDNEVFNNIFNKLKIITGSNNPVIDYLIISHSHSDHSGNLNSILSNDNIKVKNVIYKNEKLANGVKKIVDGKKNRIDNIIETTSLNKTFIQYKINDNISMILFNLNDIYINYDLDMCKKNYYSVKFSSSKRNTNLMYNGQYIYLDSLDPNNEILKYSDSIENISDDLGLDSNNNPKRRYYAYASSRDSLCNANANSLAILLEIKTDKSVKYIYLPSDLENNGYSFFGNMNQTALKQGFMYGKIYSSGTTYIYKNSYNGKTVSINNAWNVKDGKLVDDNLSIKVAAESRVANQIRNYLGNNLKNIVIYQESHHGFNNAKDAIDTLDLNRKGVYSIVTGTDSGYNSSDALLARGYHYVLNKTSILETGKNNGVYCVIKNDGAYSCNNS